jgi:hypothetical protein
MLLIIVYWVKHIYHEDVGILLTNSKEKVTGAQVARNSLPFLETEG